MIKPNVEKAFNKHMNAELFSWYLYLALSAHFENKNLLGFANWLKFQAGEEMGHAMKFYDYLAKVNAKTEFLPIEAPKAGWKSPLDAFQQVYDHEVKITNGINELMELSINEKDYPAINFLKWFVDEQVEEVQTSNIILEKVKLVGDNPNGLFLLDRELAQRSATT